MGRLLLGEKRLTNAEKQARHVKKKNERIKILEELANTTELDKTLLAEQRRIGRELARKADHNFDHGRIVGICEVAIIFIAISKIETAKYILKTLDINRKTAEEALKSDRRKRSPTLEMLDKANVWS